jgi:hypothetical protein
MRGLSGNTAVAYLACAVVAVFLAHGGPAHGLDKPAVQSSELPPIASAELTPQYLDNLRNCLLGNSYGCRPFLLTPDDLAKAQAAEYLRNFSTCLNGYRFSCKHTLLLPRDLERVKETEYQTNVRTCLNGNSVGCLHSDLRAEDFAAVQKAEYKVNLDRCTSPYKFGCKQDLLTPEDRERVTSSPTASTQQTGSPLAPTVGPLAKAVPGCAENGSCYGDISALTGRPKTVAVSGYFRSNGTYVRGYYRSAPSRR